MSPSRWRGFPEAHGDSSPSQRRVGLPLEQFTPLAPAEIDEVATLKLSLVGLRDFEDYFPSEISGGMQKRAGLARAIALHPDVLFFDEPSAGLDPVTARLLDDLILSLRDSLGGLLSSGPPTRQRAKS